MAEITSGDDLTVIVMERHEADALAALLSDWVDDSYSRGTDCADMLVIADYRRTADALRDVFDSFDVTVGA